MIWLWGAVGVVVLYGGFLAFASFANARVTAELQDTPEGARAQRVMLITLPSAKAIRVNYLEENGFVYAGADGRWWRELRGEGAEVRVEIKGETRRGRARAIENDPDRTHDVFSRLRPTAPAWLPDWLNGVLVEIQFDGA